MNSENSGPSPRERQHYYAAIAAEIKGKIRDGSLPPGSRLPSTAQLCVKYGVSTITVRAAIKELVVAGLVESKPRSGFWVSVPAAQAKTRSDLIAFVVESVNSAFFSECIEAVEEAVTAAGYHLVVVSSHASAVWETQHIRRLAGEVAGMIIMPVAESGNYEAFLPLLQDRIPFVFIDRHVDRLAVPVVETDNELGGYLAASHLIQCGHRRVLALWDRNVSSQQARLRGYRRAMREAGLDTTGLEHLTPLVGTEGGYLTMQSLLANRSSAEPLALFALYDNLARGAYLALKEAGLEIPRDAAIVGFDDINAIFMDPPLTSIRQDMHEMGRMAARSLLTLIAGQEAPPMVRLAPELVVRNSTDGGSAFRVTPSVLRSNGRQMTPKSAGAGIFSRSQE